MTTIEILCTVIGAISIILGGVWFIVEKSMKLGETKQKIRQLDEKTKHSNCEHNSGVIKSVDANIEDFMFELTLYKISKYSRSQFATLNKGRGTNRLYS